MKKLFVLLVIFLIPLASFSTFNAGISVGYNATQISTDWDNINSNFKSGFQIGLFSRFGGTIFLQPEIHYASRGGFQKFEQEIIDGLNIPGSSTEIHTGIVQVPIMLGLRLLNAEVVKISAQAGPVFSIVADKGIAGVDEVFKKNNFEDFSYGVQVGAGIDVLSFTLNVRYEYPLSEIYNGTWNNQKVSAFANTFFITLGWKIL